MTYDEVIRLRVSAEMRVALEVAAAADKRTLSDWVRLALERALEERERTLARALVEACDDATK